MYLLLSQIYKYNFVYKTFSKKYISFHTYYVYLLNN